RPAFREFALRGPDAVGLATDDHVGLVIDEIHEAVPKKRMLVRDQDSRFLGMLFSHVFTAGGTAALASASVPSFTSFGSTTNDGTILFLNERQLCGL
ncbi:MAG: hypothetical protein DMF09_12250, partial [Verrucomicrobia bacterium]